MSKTIRTSSLPVKTCLSHTWKDFCDKLHECWAQSTALADWAARELDRRDVVRMPDDKKLPAMPRIPKTRKGRKWLRGLYGLASVTFNFAGGFWKGAAICAGSIIRAVERKYRKERPAAIWSRTRTSARYRYPYPYPVHPTCWDVEFRSGRPVLCLKLPGSAFEIELRTGQEFARQVGDLRRIASGEAKKCQLIFSRQRSYGSHRRTLADREPGGGNRASYRIMVRFVFQSETTKKAADRVLTLCTDPNAFWVAELDGRRAWVLNADHIKRAYDWQQIHQARRQRWSEDCKAESRGNSRRRRQFQEHRDRLCEKQSRRLRSWCQESASHLAAFAERQNVGHVLYRNIDKSYMPSFPWAMLKDCLAHALKQRGIAIDFATEPEPEKSGEEEAA